MALKGLWGWGNGSAQGWSNTSIVANTRPGSTAAYSMEPSSTSGSDVTTVETWDASTETLYFGSAVWIEAGFSDITFWSMGRQSGTSEQAFISLRYIVGTSSLELYVADSVRGIDTLVGTATGVLPEESWTYLEVGFLVNDTTGVAKLRINGTEVVDFSGDTRIDGTFPAIGGVLIDVDISNTQSIRWKDAYCCTDTSDGADPFTGFQGDIVAEWLPPTSDVSANLTPVGEVDNYNNLDDDPANDAQYNESNVATTADRFGIANRADTGTPLGLQVWTRASKNGAGVRTLETDLHSGATTASGASQVLADGTFVDHVDSYAVNPDGDIAWAGAAVDAVEVTTEVAT